jgi:serpin B
MTMNGTKLLVSILLVGLLACSKDEPLLTNEPGQPDIRVEPTVLTASMEDFSQQLFTKVLEQEEAGKNIVLSPLSVAAALYMTYNGADGSTQTAMSEALALQGMSADTLNAAFEALSNVLQQTSGNTQLQMANAVFWDENRVVPGTNFLTPLQDQYQAETIPGDFANNPDQVLATINDWVNDQTEGRIDKILEQLNPEEVLFLVNALYFIGDWDQPFPEETTTERDFQLSDGRSIQVPTMFQDNELRVLMKEAYAAVELAFDDGDYVMRFVLPPTGTDIVDWLDAEQLASIQQSIQDEAQRQRIMLTLPKFELNYKISLNEMLKALGMEVAFNPSAANFSKIGSFLEGSPYISRVEHKAFLKIDEKGAEGAAVTAVGVGVTSAPPAIDFNRPFMIQLVHKPSNTSIFTGIIQNPVEEN